MQLKARALKMVGEWKRDKASSAIAKAAKEYITNPRGFWTWAHDQMEDTGGGSHSAETLLDETTGLLVSDPAEVNKLWGRHYGDLARDPLKGSPSPWMAHWDRWRKRHRQSHGRAQMTDLDNEIQWDEVLPAIKHMKYHKAPGEDGIPTEFLKLATRTHRCEFGEALLEVLRRTFKSRVIPEEWRSSTVVSIPKAGGDPTLMTGYRGISLMPTVLKLLVSFISRRLNAAFEEKDLFHRSQAGFRSKEECPLQVAALFDITKMRAKASYTRDGKDTFMLFVDLKKAYDTVPHEMLFIKLKWWGVPEIMLGFLKVLYASSTFRVRSGGLRGIFSEPQQLERGLRQGCPASPTLFNIYINDIFWFRPGQDLGVLDPSVRRDMGQMRLVEKRIPGLLFADDLVAIVPKAHVAPMCAHLTEWAATMGMSFGIKKCGLMGYQDEAQKWLRESGPYFLGGEELPVLDEYKYLGLWLDTNFSLEHMATRRMELGKEALLRSKAYLTDNRNRIDVHLYYRRW